jgi:hypothetical protein
MAETETQTARGTESDPAAPLLREQTPEVGELIQGLRALVKEVIPQATERVHTGWGVIHYGVGGRMRDLILALAPRRAYVNLEFGDGTTLPDPAHRLEGTGKRLRHVKIRSLADAQHPDVRALLVAAARQRGLAP